MSIGGGGNSGGILSDIGQPNQVEIGEVTTVGAMTGLYTPLHTTSDFPEARHIKLSVCADCAARRGEEGSAERNESRCNQALTSLVPRRRGRAWTPVAPATWASQVAKRQDGGIGVLIGINIIGLANPYITVVAANLKTRVTELATTEPIMDMDVVERQVGTKGWMETMAGALRRRTADN